MTDPNPAPDAVPVKVEYRKTATIRASQWWKMGDHPAVEMVSDVKAAIEAGHPVPWCTTLEGGHVVTPGDWIATGVQGEHWPIKADIFAATYEPVTSPVARHAEGPSFMEDRTWPECLDPNASHNQRQTRLAATSSDRARGVGEVTRADRDAAASAVQSYRGEKDRNWQRRIRNGECDDGEMVRSYARHRQPAEQRALAAEKERDEARISAKAWEDIAREDRAKRVASEQRVRALVEVARLAGDVRWQELADGQPFTKVDRLLLRDLYSTSRASLPAADGESGEQG